MMQKDKTASEMLKQVHDMATFPEENPNPVLRLSGAGEVLFANSAARALAGLLENNGSRLPHELRVEVAAAHAARQTREVEFASGEQHFSFVVTPVPGKAYINLYGREITEERRAHLAVLKARAELARVGRLTTMGELVASIAHEINQPLAAIAVNGDACLRWLNRDEPDLDEVRNAVSRITQDGRRAGQMIENLRALAKKSEPQFARLDINGAIQEILALTRSELTQHDVVLHTDLSVGDRMVFGDRVQLQQVMLNLIMNGIEAMSAVMDRPKILTISSERVEPSGILVAVKDTGAGVDPATADRIFESFFTTKPNGMGMGLSICRSIIEAHGERFWASPNTPHGAIFQFTLPADGRGPPTPKQATSSS
jgi:C4-dicarboxylate-specific signal transduction histidine kinase